MKERPILFSGAMVQAILDNRKTQTRRVIKRPEQWMIDGGSCEDKNGDIVDVKKFCPYGQAGDRLWVRETWAAIKLVDLYKPSEIPLCNQILLWYKADPQYPPYEINPWLEGNCGKWRTGRFMPRWASRITLEITGIRVERVQEISGEDCEAEGLLNSIDADDWDFATQTIREMELQRAYSSLWDSINTKRGYSWESNPFVWVIEFKRVEAHEQPKQDGSEK